MDGLVRSSIAAIKAYEAGKPLEELARELGVADAVKLASNENPLGCSARVEQALHTGLRAPQRYPDAAAFELRERLAAHLGVRRDEIVQGNGSNELIDLCVRTFTTQADHVVFAEPSFAFYRIAALSHGVPFTAVPLRNDTHDLADMAAALTPRTRLVFVANPNNPTGTTVTRAEFERFLKNVPAHVVVVVDEAYFEYVDDVESPNALDFRGLRERLLVLRTFSKIHGLAALRVGYGVGAPELVNYLHRVRQPFNVNGLAQLAAIAALEDTAHVERSRALNLSERARLTRELTEAGLEVVRSQANFVFVHTGRNARAIYDGLLRKGVIVRAFSDLPDALRITVGLPEENTRLLGALGSVLRET